MSERCSGGGALGPGAPSLPFRPPRFPTSPSLSGLPSATSTERLQPCRASGLSCQDGMGAPSVLGPEKATLARRPGGGPRSLRSRTPAGAAAGSGAADCPAFAGVLGHLEAPTAHRGPRQEAGRRAGGGAWAGPAAPAPQQLRPRAAAPLARDGVKGLALSYLAPFLPRGTSFTPKLNLALLAQRQVRPSRGTGGPGGWPVFPPFLYPFVLAGLATRSQPQGLGPGLGLSLSSLRPLQVL